MKAFLLWLLVTVGVLIATYITLVEYLDIPLVEKHAVTKQCLRVSVPENKPPLTCAEALKGKYETIWVAK
jgi:hypothetical protein